MRSPSNQAPPVKSDVTHASGRGYAHFLSHCEPLGVTGGMHATSPCPSHPTMGVLLQSTRDSAVLVGLNVSQEGYPRRQLPRVDDHAPVLVLKADLGAFPTQQNCMGDRLQYRLVLVLAVISLHKTGKEFLASRVRRGVVRLLRRGYSVGTTRGSCRTLAGVGWGVLLLFYCLTKDGLGGTVSLLRCLQMRGRCRLFGGTKCPPW